MLKSLKKLSNERGYLLVEVLLASIIVTVGIVALLRSFDRSLHVAGFARDHARAICLLEQRLSELESESPGYTVAAPEDSLEWASGFEIDVKRLDSEGPLGEIRITARWDEGGRPRSVSVSALVPASPQHGGRGER